MKKKPRRRTGLRAVESEIHFIALSPRSVVNRDYEEPRKRALALCTRGNRKRRKRRMSSENVLEGGDESAYQAHDHTYSIGEEERVK
jgi:hypothetical protein